MIIIKNLSLISLKFLYVIIDKRGFLTISFILYLFTSCLNGQDKFQVKNTTKWNFDHYEATDNVIFGIWPHDARVQGPGEINKLLSKYGFNHIFLTASLELKHLNLFLDSGYSRNRIMAQVTDYDYLQKIKDYGSIYAYYIDEPAEHGVSIAGIREAINRYAPGSLFIVSGYRRISRLNDLVAESDGVMFSSYKHWWQCLPGVWCSWPVDSDQRPDWTDMKERYSDKSFMNWVGAHRDLGDYGDLLQHAVNLDLSGIWFYQYQETLNSDDNILNLCFNAWAEGYLKRFERKYLYEYRCTDCEDQDSGNWFLYKITPMEEVIEIQYNNLQE